MRRLMVVMTVIGVIAMASLANATPYNDAVLADGPHLYWTFDEVVDTADAVSLVNQAASNNLVSYAGGTRTTSGATAGGVSLGRAATSPLDNSRFSTGVGNGMIGDGSVGVLDNAWAVEFWLMPASDTGQYIMASLDESPSFLYGVNPNGPEELEMWASWNGARLGETNVSVGEWHHVVGAWYSNLANEEIYIDGALAASSAPYSSWLPLDTFTVGSRPFGHPGGFTGSVDEVAIYVLGGTTAEQQAAVADIAGHYNIAPPPPFPSRPALA